MTKEITKAFILQQMQDKLKLRELAPEKFSFSEMVIPTYNIEQHLLNPEIVSFTNTITAIGGPVFFSVPPTERWTLHAYNIVFKTGVYAVTGVYIVRTETADYFYLDMVAGQTTSYSKLLPKDVMLDPGDEIHLYVDSYTSTGNLELRCDITQEILR